MKRIYKYELLPYIDQVHILQEGAKVLSAGFQKDFADNDHLYVWALVDPIARGVMHRFHVVPTGPDVYHENLGTFIGRAETKEANDMPLVFHVFDGGEVE